MFNVSEKYVFGYINVVQYVCVCVFEPTCILYLSNRFRWLVCAYTVYSLLHPCHEYSAEMCLRGGDDAMARPQVLRRMAYNFTCDVIPLLHKHCDIYEYYMCFSDAIGTNSHFRNASWILRATRYICAHCGGFWLVSDCVYVFCCICFVARKVRGDNTRDRQPGASFSLRLHFAFYQDEESSTLNENAHI